ncbi:MAG: alanine racemase [Ruminococcus sp.]|nr:alanine racemase [Ruminococcus sp.]
MIKVNDVRDTEIIINLGVIRENMELIKEMVGKSVKVMAVVKANAYGHGIVKMAPVLRECGADYLAVATLTEALQLRDQYPDYPIFIMGHTPDRLLETVVEYDIAQTVFSYEQAEKLNEAAEKQGKTAVVHIKVDTGFHRLGKVPSDEFRDEIIKIMELPNVKVEGIFSHLALESKESNDKQFESFMNFVEEVEKKAGREIEFKHIADSIATVDFPQYRLNMVRVGALIYGMRGFHKGFLPVTPALQFQTCISQIHHIKKGEGVSYDYLWRAPEDSVIATLPFGYADGYPRNLRDKGYVLINGSKAPIVGVICMDQCMADVTGIPNIGEGSRAIIYGNGLNGSMTIDEAAKLAETNKNDILSRLTTRPPRVYIDNQY